MMMVMVMIMIMIWYLLRFYAIIQEFYAIILKCTSGILAIVNIFLSYCFQLLWAASFNPTRKTSRSDYLESPKIVCISASLRGTNCISCWGRPTYLVLQNEQILFARYLRFVCQPIFLHVAMSDKQKSQKVSCKVL